MVFFKFLSTRTSRDRGIFGLSDGGILGGSPPLPLWRRHCSEGIMKDYAAINNWNQSSTTSQARDQLILSGTFGPWYRDWGTWPTLVPSHGLLLLG